MEPILGRTITDKPVKISSLTLSDELITIQGKISHLKEKVLNGGSVLLLTFILTDGSSSVLCKAFLRCGSPGIMDGNEKADSSSNDEKRKTALSKLARIRTCKFVKIRGEYALDNVLHKMSVIIRDLSDAEKEDIYGHDAL